MYDLSIVIITKNEEKYLPRLLSSIKRQHVQDLEVIVSDYHSTDKTREIAKKNTCKIVDGGFFAHARNRGFEATTRPLILFVDGDSYLPDNFLKELVGEFKKQGLDVASGFVKPDRQSVVGVTISFLRNWIWYITQSFAAEGFGTYILAKRTTIEKYGAFNESYGTGEDTEFIKRMAQKAKYRFLNRPYMYFSTRRFDKKGWIRTNIWHLNRQIKLKLFGIDGIKETIEEIYEEIR